MLRRRHLLINSPSSSTGFYFFTGSQRQQHQFSLSNLDKNYLVGSQVQLDAEAHADISDAVAKGERRQRQRQFMEGNFVAGNNNIKQNDSDKNKPNNYYCKYIY